MKEKIKNFWEKYEPKVILILGFILVAALSFQAGVLRGQKLEKSPIIIEKPIQTENNFQRAPEAQNLAPEAQKSSNEINDTSQKCAFVGSKNSNKYHLPTCRYAKNINPDNLVCFSSADEAKSKGYLPDKNCIK